MYLTIDMKWMVLITTLIALHGNHCLVDAACSNVTGSTSTLLSVGDVRSISTRASGILQMEVAVMVYSGNVEVYVTDYANFVMLTNSWESAWRYIDYAMLYGTGCFDRAYHSAGGFNGAAVVAMCMSTSCNISSSLTKEYQTSSPAPVHSSFPLWILAIIVPGVILLLGGAVAWCIRSNNIAQKKREAAAALAAADRHRATASVPMDNQAPAPPAPGEEEAFRRGPLGFSDLYQSPCPMEPTTSFRDWRDKQQKLRAQQHKHEEAAKPSSPPPVAVTATATTPMGSPPIKMELSVTTEVGKSGSDNDVEQTRDDKVVPSELGGGGDTTTHTYDTTI